jgi:hypothetical protein
VRERRQKKALTGEGETEPKKEGVRRGGRGGRGRWTKYLFKCRVMDTRVSVEIGLGNLLLVFIAGR